MSAIKNHSLKNKATRKVARHITRDPLTGRSSLSGLTKEEIVETLIAQMPITAFAHVVPLLAKKINRRTGLFIESAITRLDQRAKALMTLPKAQLVDLVYTMSDDRLNALNPGSRHKTTPTERRTDVRKKAFVLKSERAIEVNPYWEKVWRKRDRKTYQKNAEKVAKRATKVLMTQGVKEKKPIVRKGCPNRTRRESKKVTRSWIAQMRAHNRFITSETEPTFHSVEI